MAAYYNEIDPYAAQWLRNLISEGHISPGDVDERSIVDVRADDLKGYEQAHFFAGIGGWSYALRLAGWPDDEPCWTGSCPCQSLSGAGQRKGHADKRHLWPAFYRLISECRPAIVFGEQVASKDGREWLAGIRADLEALGYACGASDLCSAGVGAPHLRQRLYWMAHANGGDACSERLQRGRQHRQQPQDGRGSFRLGHAASARLQGEWSEYRPSGERHGGLVGLAVQAGVPEWNGPTIAVKCSDAARRVSAQPGTFPLAHGVSARMGKLRAAGNAIDPILGSTFIIAASEAISNTRLVGN